MPDRALRFSTLSDPLHVCPALRDTVAVAAVVSLMPPPTRSRKRPLSTRGIAALLLFLASACASAPKPPPPAIQTPPEEQHGFTGVVLKSGKTLPNLATIKGEIVRYHDSGLWAETIERVAAEARARLDELLPTSKRPALVLDIDDTALSTYSLQRRLFFGFMEEEWDRWMADQSPPANRGILDLYEYAQKRGVAVFFVTGRREFARTATERQLRTAGYDTWAGLELKPTHYQQQSVVPYKAGARERIEAQGYDILVNVGDQWSDLDGGHAVATFKLPNPIYVIP
jgi:hypothetical protein